MGVLNKLVRRNNRRT